MTVASKETKAKKEKPESASADQPKIIAYKGFDKNFRCRGYQFEVGKTYKHAGDVKACEGGFHACENPFDVWSYYGVAESKFAIVELGGKTDRHNEDSKIASAEITIKAELSLPEFISRAIAWVIDATRGKDDGSSGYRARIGSSGNDAQIGSSGYCAQVGSSGNDAQIGSSGYCAQIGSSGDGAQIGSSGDYARIGSSGNNAQIGSSGYCAQIGSSGDGAQIGSSGYDARIGSSGNNAQIGSSGDDARIEADGEKAVVASAGMRPMLRGRAGTHFSLASYDNFGNFSGFVTGCIGENGIKEGTWYIARNGKLEEVA